LLAGVPLHVVAARLGPSDPATTLRTYSHLLLSSQRGRGRSDRRSDLRLVGDAVCRKSAGGGTDRIFGRVCGDLAKWLLPSSDGAFSVEPTPGLEPGTARLQGEQLVPAGLSMPRKTGLNAVIAGKDGCPQQEFMDKLMDSQSAWTIAPPSSRASRPTRSSGAGRPRAATERP
jgi:hypothetical protein